MDAAAVLTEIYERFVPLARNATEGLDARQLIRAPQPGANPIGWLVWHAARVQDHHVAELLEAEQVWGSGGWAARFGLGPDPDNTGYGHSPADVASVQPDGAGVLVEYLDAVGVRTREMLRTLSPHDLDDIVDERWDPPVTRGVRLASIADDTLQHLGQAAYLRGMLIGLPEGSNGTTTLS